MKPYKNLNLKTISKNADLTQNDNKGMPLELGDFSKLWLVFPGIVQARSNSRSVETSQLTGESCSSVGKKGVLQKGKSKVQLLGKRETKGHCPQEDWQLSRKLSML